MASRALVLHVRSPYLVPHTILWVQLGFIRQIETWQNPHKYKKHVQEALSDNLVLVKGLQIVFVFCAGRGRPPTEPLPDGWIMTFHNSGVPVYLHRESRVVTWSRPYFLGTGSIRVGSHLFHI